MPDWSAGTITTQSPTAPRRTCVDCGKPLGPRAAYTNSLRCKRCAARVRLQVQGRHLEGVPFTPEAAKAAALAKHAADREARAFLRRYRREHPDGG